MTNEVARIAKRTVAVLYELRADLRGVHDLGQNMILRETDHTGIREAMDEYLAGLREPGESFRTYLSPHERDEFYSAHLSLEHCFEAPDYVGEDEKRSEAEIQKVITALRVVGSTLANPGLYLGWERRGGSWELRRFCKSGFSVHLATEEEDEDVFGVDEIRTLTEMMPRVLRAYSGHGGGRFNRVANALNFFEMAYRSAVAEVRFVLLTTALESLFVTSDQSISAQFRERISRFMTPDAAIRQRVLQTCRQIYNTRSAIVHGGPVERRTSEVYRLMCEAQRIARTCLHAILSDDNLFARFCGAAGDLGCFLDQGPHV